MRGALRLGAGVFLGVACAQILNTDGIVIVGGPTPSTADAGAPACEPGERRCVGAALQLCNSTQSGFRTARVCSTPALCCADSSICPSGGCLAPACSAGELRCEGRVLSVCNDEQTGWVPVTTCPSAAQCNASQGRCTEAACSPTAPDYQCSGGALLECGGADWRLQVTCETNSLCSTDPNTRGCRPSGCRVGEAELPSPFRCENADLMRCNDEQTGFEFVETCLNARHCNGLLGLMGDTAGENLAPGDLERLGCSPPDCTPGRYKCVGSRLVLCDPDRAIYRIDAQDCGSPSRCNASLGRCTPEDCTPNEEQCNGNEYQVCTPERTWQTVQTCPGGAAQCDTQSEGGCRVAACEFGEYQCTGATLERCNVYGTGWIPVHTCTSAELCNAAAKRCDAPVCEPGQRRCTRDGKLQECAAGRDGWQLVADCRQQANLPATASAEQASGLCDLAGVGRCLDAASCVSGQLRCNSEFLERCEDNAWRPLARCDAPGLCDTSGSGSCRPAACEPGTHRCVTPGATPMVAETGDSMRGLTLQVCNAAGSGYVTVRDCPSDNYCDAPHGQCDICDALELLCFDDRLYRCSADGQERELEKACRQGCGAAAAPDAGASVGGARPEQADQPTCLEDVGRGVEATAN